MKVLAKKTDIFDLNGLRTDFALSRTTHLGIGAHQDDLEIMAFHGIAKCYGSKSKWFSGVTCGDGAGSPRSGRYAKVSDADMRELRKEEQRKAAKLGRYSAMLQLGYSSAAIRKKNRDLDQELREIILKTNPDVLYTHNLFDRHDTHVALALHVIQVLRSLPKSKRPRKVIGCEVWRSLDWLPEKFKIRMDVSGKEVLAKRLLQVYRSQNQGGKRYDLATLARRRANATFDHLRSVDTASAVILGIDLTPLVNARHSVTRFIREIVQEFQRDLGF